MTKRLVPAIQEDPAPLWMTLSSPAVLQVRISYFGEASGVPVGRAMLYLTCVGKLGCFVPKTRCHCGARPDEHPCPRRRLTGRRHQPQRVGGQDDDGQGNLGLQPPTPSLSLTVSSAPLCCPQATWTWGPDGHGAILLVNCDRDDPKSRVMDNRDTAVRSYEGTAAHLARFFCFSLLSVTFLPNLSSLSP